MKRLVICLVIACVVGFALVGCSSSKGATGASGGTSAGAAAQSGPQTATFKSYEIVDTGTSADMPGGTKGPNGNTMMPSGKANLVLSDGTAVKATCPIEGLKSGDSVKIQKDNKGNWTVTGKA